MGRPPKQTPTKTPTERSRARREREAKERDRLRSAIRAMLATPRLPGAAREIGRVALKGKENA